MTRFEISVAVSIMIAPGCAASHQPATSGLAPVAPAAVQVFMDREPERPYVSVGRFTIERDRAHSGAVEGGMLDDARSSAAAMGANAIVVTSIPASVNRMRYAGKGYGSGDGAVELTEMSRPALDVLAVVWTCSGSR